MKNQILRVCIIYQTASLYRPAYLSFIKNKVVSVMKSGTIMRYLKMSVGDNLILPSLRNMRLVYMVSGDKMSEILSEEMEHESLINNDIVYHLDKNNHINISFNRWYVFNPKQLYFMNRLPVVMPMEFLLYCLILKKWQTEEPLLSLSNQI